VLVNLPELGIPTWNIPCSNGAEQLKRYRAGTYAECAFLFTSEENASGKTWDCVKVVSGTYPYDKPRTRTPETFCPNLNRSPLRCPIAISNLSPARCRWDGKWRISGF